MKSLIDIENLSVQEIDDLIKLIDANQLIEISNNNEKNCISKNKTSTKKGKFFVEKRRNVLLFGKSADIITILTKCTKKPCGFIEEEQYVRKNFPKCSAAIEREYGSHGWCD